MSGTGEPLGRYIEPALDEARLFRQRAAIAARTSSPRRPLWFLALVPVACAIGIVLLLLRSHGSPASGPVAGTVVEAPAAEPLPVTLLDGSRVVLEPQTRLSLMTLLAKDIRLQLDRGGVDLDVTHVDDRQFVVTAGGYEVRVLGTRFSVRLLTPEEGSTLEVRVARGRVRVTRVGETADVRVLGAGETWSTVLEGRSGDVPPPPPRASATVGETKTAPEPATAAPIDSSAPTLAPAAAPSAAAQVPAGSTELWAQAESARASKRFRDESVALNTLRRRYRSDPRAGLAAFELGRLRQDTLHDPAGAAEAFADAVVLAPNGPFREDAEARRIEALEMAGDRQRCVEAKAAFLARYPGGIHRQRVSARCEGR